MDISLMFSKHRDEYWEKYALLMVDKLLEFGDIYWR